MIQQTTKKRQVTTLRNLGVSNTYSGPDLVGSTSPITSASFRQETISNGNPISRLGKGEDLGGFFQTRTARNWNQPVKVKASTGPRPAGIWYTYDGLISAYNADFDISTFAYQSPSDLIPWGTRAIARCIPTNPLSGMGQFLGELRDLPKPLDLANWQAIVRNARHETRHLNFDKISRKAAGEYLNHVFGWVPFIKDLQDFARVVQMHAPLMRKYASDSGHNIHRSYYFPDDVTTTVSSSTNEPGRPVLVDPLYSKKGRIDRTQTTTSKKWFKGTFCYYLPPVEDDDNDFVKFINKTKTAEAYANKLLGIRPTPDLIYKLTPWSWAADWLTTSGDVVHNWSAFANDGLVMRHGYIMETKSSVDSRVLSGLELSGQGPVPTCIQTFESENKRRQRATPFGFGVLETSLSKRQWGIIAALGISRQPLSLNI